MFRSSSWLGPDAPCASAGPGGHTPAWQAGVVSAAGGGCSIRVATRADFARLQEIEAEADQMFAAIGIGPFRDDSAASHLAAAAVVFVAHEPPIGFVSVEIVDGAAHLWQLAVVPSMQRRGVGRALLEAVCDWARGEGYAALTLTTYRDVPWNGPYYEKLGFHELSDLTSGLAAIRQHERDLGDDDFGSRIAMRLDL